MPTRVLMNAAGHASARQLAELMRDKRRVTVLTGAGVSAASGVPTFRGPGGFGRDRDPMTLATPQAFAADPRLVWEWYDWRRQNIAAAQPNAAHHVLARWAQARPDFTLITQNVDGLHERAGTPRVLRLHGSIWHVQCAGRCGATPRLDERVPMPGLPDTPPHCETCGALLRPSVVWFGEGLDRAIVAAASRATRCDLFITIGTSAVVYPAAGFIHEARACGATVAEINPDVTDASESVDLSIRGTAETILPEVERLLAIPDPGGVRP
jgi:NAD-dependent deacetylase